MEKFVSSKQVFVNVDVDTREKALEFISQKGAELGYGDADAVYKAFMARGNEGATGMEKGFAVPHAKSDVINKAGLLLVKLAAPVEWPSFDDKPVDVALALLVPGLEAGTTHLKLLSKAAVMLMDENFRNSVHASDDPEVLAELINAGLEG